jgi:hypothetical protein
LLQSQSSGLSTSSQNSLVLEVEDDIGPTRQEGESYLSTPPVINGDSSDILGWWKRSETTYPRLAQVAKDILAVQIAQVGVERVFNIAKDVIGDRRHRLSAQTIRQIMIVKHTILGEQPIALPNLRTDEDSVPCDEVDDLLELPANIELLSDAGSVRQVNTSDEEVQTPSRREQPPRKKVKPSRYCNE